MRFVRVVALSLLSSFATSAFVSGVAKAQDDPAATGTVGDVVRAPEPRTTVEITAPSTVDVSVDGQVVGTTPVVLSLSPGTYTIRGNRPGTVTTSTVVIVRANEPRRIVLPVESPRSATWVWVGLGGAVLLGAVLGVALASGQR